MKSDHPFIYIYKKFFHCVFKRPDTSEKKNPKQKNSHFNLKSES